MLVAWLLVAWLPWPRSSWLDGRVGLNLPEFREGPGVFSSASSPAELCGPFFTHERHNDEVDILAMQGVRAVRLLYKFGREQIWEKLAAIFEVFGGVAHATWSAGLGCWSAASHGQRQRRRWKERQQNKAVRWHCGGLKKSRCQSKEG